jgi:hypothetical protein
MQIHVEEGKTFQLNRDCRFFRDKLMGGGIQPDTRQWSIEYHRWLKRIRVSFKEPQVDGDARMPPIGWGTMYLLGVVKQIYLPYGLMLRQMTSTSY